MSSALPLPLLLAVAIGGALGTAARIGVGALAGLGDPAAAEAIATASTVDALGAFTDGALLATLAANLLGTLALGIVSGAHWPERLAWLRAALGPGFCGAFTTFSFVTLALAVLGFDSAIGWGLLVGSVALGLLFVAVGSQLGRAWRPGPGPGDSSPAAGEETAP